MQNRVERLRVWLLGSAIFLTLVIAAFIGYARFLSRFRHLKMPANLGVNIVRETDGFTYSQSVQGKTVYTIHASKAVEHTDGKIALHHVFILLYGRSGSRSDRIYGDEFEYDVKAGVVRALGLVHIDLQASEPATGQANKPVGPGDADAAPNPKMLHVTTSGLVYMEKLGVAATREYIEFQSGAMKGHATGADYSSDSGMLMLHSAVSMSGVAGGAPAEMSAAAAEFDDRGQQVFLTHATYSSLGRIAEADHATLHTRSDGALTRVEAQGNVTIRTNVGANGGTTVSQRADIQLNAAGHPQSAMLSGGVQYSSDQPLRQVRGKADEATIAFDGQSKPQPEHAVFTGAVHMIERTRATEAAREPWSVRELTAAKLETALAPAGSGNAQLRDAEATGNPVLTLVSNGSLAGASGNGRTELSADDLKTHLTGTGDGRRPPQLDTTSGRGHTLLRQVNLAGVEQSSAGDTLDAKFRPAAASNVGKARAVAPNGGSQALDTLASAVQQGHVSMTRHVPAQSGTQTRNKSREDVEHAVADRAVYDGDRDRVTLTGGVQGTDAGSTLWAKQVALDRASGDSQAEGAVKADYVREDADASRGAAAKSGAARTPVEATHILADRAELVHATDVATFHGKPVRLWQGASQVQAPVVELSRAQKRLIARGEESTGWSGAVQAPQVHTVLVNAGSEKSGLAGPTAEKVTTPKCGSGSTKAGVGPAGSPDQTPNVVRIASGGLIYSENLREVNFTGGIRADTVDASIRANQATAYLHQAEPQVQAAASSGGMASVPSIAGDLERVVATGHVDIVRPEMRATGEQLLYAASDRVFLLTGDKNSPPKGMDAQGPTPGAALRFDSCENSVEALGTVPGTPAQRVRTDAQVSDDRKKLKGKQ